jgi:cytochrome c biogenesis DsbD-like protein/AhpC/TSA family protein
MLSDPESKVIRAFGILNENFPKDNPFYGVAFPGTYIVDEKGIVRAKYFEDDHRERYTAGNILWRHFGDTAGEKATAQARHLRLTLAASNATVWAGTRLALVLDIEMKPGIHVYAPGVEGGYIPIEWKIFDTPGWLAQDVAYPAARKLHLPVIHETVPVYEGRLRLTRDLIVGQTPEFGPLAAPDRHITVEGSFRYQACDDKECYPPETIPLTWTFPAVPLDSQRAPRELQRK